jgi:ATP-dependent RNA helicase RhlE
MLDEMATGRVLVFTRTKRRARFLARDLDKKGYKAEALQGNMSQNRRQKAMDGFRSGKYDILVATDIAARGIDVADISHVINFDMPDTADAYTHRIGRTGRAEEEGDAFTFATEDDAAMIRDIERVLKTRLERRRWPGFNYGDFDPEKPLVTNQSNKKPSDGTNSGGQKNYSRRGGSGAKRRPSGQRRQGGNNNNRSRSH